MIFICIKNTEENNIGSDSDLTYLKEKSRKVFFFESQTALYQLTVSQVSAAETKSQSAK